MGTNTTASRETIIHGTVTRGFEAVRTASGSNFATQGDVGASVAITIGGEPVVDRWGFWGGWGGSLAIIDVDAQLSFAYVMNRMGEGTTGDMRAAGLLLAAYRSLAG